MTFKSIVRSIKEDSVFGSLHSCNISYFYESRLSLSIKFSRFILQVWLDDYAKYFYDRIGNNLGEYGNVENRMQLKQKLNCKSFDWYLEKVYPYLSIPNDLVGSGRVSCTLTFYNVL